MPVPREPKGQAFATGIWLSASLAASSSSGLASSLSQLRYVPRDSNTFGFGIWRDIQRYTERVSWPLYRNSQIGISSQLGELRGLVGLPSPRRPEISPYVVTKNLSIPTGTEFDRSQKVTAGADLKYGITSNLTLDATVNPDFGQVEADPSVLNLSAFETFFPESTSSMRLQLRSCSIFNWFWIC